MAWKEDSPCKLGHTGPKACPDSRSEQAELRPRWVPGMEKWALHGGWEVQGTEIVPFPHPEQLQLCCLRPGHGVIPGAASLGWESRKHRVCPVPGVTCATLEGGQGLMGFKSCLEMPQGSFGALKKKKIFWGILGQTHGVEEPRGHRGQVTPPRCCQSLLLAQESGLEPR